MLKYVLAGALLFGGSGIALADEKEVSLGTPSLWGTLAYAAQPTAPAVLMLNGSGPTDRNTNSPAGVRSNAFKMLADRLTAHGITSLRIDKRGIAASAAAMTAEADLRFQTYADDAKAWAKELKKITNTTCVWLMGHSEGALVAQVAADGNPDACGLILISGVGRKAGDLLREQLTSNAGMPADLRTAAFSALSELEAGRTVKDAPPSLMALFRPSVQPYMISWLSIDPTTLLARTKLPVLILQGDNDIQVSVHDARLLAAAQPRAKLVIVPGMNHVLKIAPADRAANAATYSDPALPLAPALAETIADFIRAR